MHEIELKSLLLSLLLNTVFPIIVKPVLRGNPRGPRDPRNPSARCRFRDVTKIS